MVVKKDKILVRRKDTPMKVRRQGEIVEVPRCVTKFGSGSMSYKFDINKTEFEIEPEHLPRVLLRCDMEVVSSLKKAKAKKVKVSEDAKVGEVKKEEDDKKE